jgi:hypothetical protein
MNVHFLKQFLSLAEPVFLAATLWAFARSKAFSAFPAFGAYLASRLAVCGSLVILLYAVHFSLLEKHFVYQTYYYVYWVGYLAGAVLALLAIQEIFKHLMRPLPFLGRYGSMAFRWVALTSVLISLAMAVYPMTQNKDWLVAATSATMRCMSILELCLLVFVLVSMQTLKLSPKSREFGASLGLGVIAAADLFGSAFAFGHSTLASVAAYGSQIVVTVGSAVWMLYFLRPAIEQDEIFAVPASSPLQRWNEIAQALTHSAPQVTLSPAPNYFLQDVENVVDRVLEKNAANSAP